MEQVIIEHCKENPVFMIHEMDIPSVMSSRMFMRRSLDNNILEFLHPAYISKHITVIDGTIYEKIHTDHIPKKSLQNIHFLDTNSDLLRPFFVQKEDKFCLIYFDLKYMHMVHFIEEHKLERTSINYHTGRKVTEIEQSSSRTIHQYLEEIMYDLIKIKASEAFVSHCEKCGITIEDRSLISDDEIELFKMAIY